MIDWFTRKMQQRNQRPPSKKAQDMVAAVLTDLGFGTGHMTQEFSESVAAHLAVFHDSNTRKHQLRVSELIEANNVEMFRRRAAEQAMRGIVAYVDQYGSDHAPAVRAILATNKVEL